jgi:hypothetical protein
VKVLIGSIRGPQGPPGPPPSDEYVANRVETYLDDNPPVTGVEHIQSEPTSTWIVAHNFGRRPNVSVIVDGEVVDTNVVATSTQVTINFPAPYTGSAILT